MLVAANMTKADEAQLLADFIGSLPANCYLSDFMQGCLPHFVHQMRSDMVFPLTEHVSEIQRQVREEAETLKVMRAKVAEQQAKLDEVMRAMEYGHRQLKEMDALAGRIKDAAGGIEYTVSKLIP